MTAWWRRRWWWKRRCPKCGLRIRGVLRVVCDDCWVRLEQAVIERWRL